MWEAFFGFKKTPFGDSPDAKQLFASQAWNQVKARLQFLAASSRRRPAHRRSGRRQIHRRPHLHRRLNPNLYKILYLHCSSGSALDLLRQIALELDLEPAHYPRRPGAPDLRRHRASQPEQEAASHSHLR